MNKINLSAGERTKPANRRRSENRKIKWQPPHNPDAPATNIHVTIGYAEDALRPVEIFYDSGYRSGSDLETLVSDVCILISVMLQHEDVDIAEFCGSIALERDLLLGEERPGSIVGVLLEELQREPAWAEEVKAAGGFISKSWEDLLRETKTR